MTVSPILLSRDHDLLDDVLRLAAVAGLEPLVMASAPDARRWWTTASLVLVGADLLDDAVAVGLPRRPGVVVVTRAEPTPALWQSSLEVGADEVIRLPDDDSALVARLVAGPDPAHPRADIVAVVGGSGGAGASVLAVALALAAARAGRDPVLVDLDVQGGGLDLALGAEDVPGARWPDLAGVSGLVAAETLRAALPSAHGVGLLAPAREGRTDISPAALEAVLDSVVASCGLVVLDLPRADPDVCAAVLARADVVLVVVTPDVRGSAAAQSVCRALARARDVRVVVRTHPSSDLDAQAVADWLGVSLAAEVGHDNRLTAALDRGEAPGLAARSQLGRVASALLLDLLGTP